MSKTETLRQSAAASNAKRLAHLAHQIETVRQAKHQSVEDLATVLEPLAQAMAALSDETRQTLMLIDRRSREQAEMFARQLQDEVRTFREITAAARKAANQMQQSTQGLRWRHYALALVTGLLTAGLVSGFWLWVAPPKIQNTLNLDPQALAQDLAPAIAALKPSRNK
ncbi:MAG: IncQ-type mobilization protein MobB [Thiomonas sp.]|nr:IncQ-type mobilization protein MobB [Thiomonas sp.]